MSNLTLDELFNIGYNQVNDFQKKILDDCFKKNFAGLSLPLGTGKTLISIILSLYFMKIEKLPTIVVASKSLISNWELEIKKFFGDKLKYEIVHQSVIKKLDLWKINPNTNFILTTPEVLSKYYKLYNFSNKFITQRFNQRVGYTNIYNIINNPIGDYIFGGGYLHSTTWCNLVIDESQSYTNCDTLKCQAIASLYANHRWLLSGTIFDEPHPKRLLGYHLLLNTPNNPRNLPDFENYLKSENFKGLNEHLIIRNENEAFIKPDIHEKIVSHNLKPEEEKLYTMMKHILQEVSKKAHEAKLLGNKEDNKKFTSYKLVMLMYLRQILVCPIIPITNIAIDIFDMKNNSELSKIVMTEINKLGINNYLNNENNVKSSRILSILEHIDKHKDERILVFGCFKSFLDILEYYMPKDRPILKMKSSMSLEKRGKLIEDFKNTNNGILLLSYDLGSNGLNLQCASTILLCDFWWNAGKTQQAIGRILRFGQLSKNIYIYFFTSNTGIEKIIFEKQNSKIKIIDELKVGKQTSTINKLNIDNVIKMIDIKDNEHLLNNIKYY
jgi:SNF2 family DNA or RNA helicase